MPDNLPTPPGDAEVVLQRVREILNEPWTDEYIIMKLRQLVAPPTRWTDTGSGSGYSPPADYPDHDAHDPRD